MQSLIASLLLLGSISLSASTQLENATCQKCHPKIFKEYEGSMHKNASIYNDTVHKAIWDLHPAKEKGKYNCAKCHTPADHDLVAGKTKLSKNDIQVKEPISCLSCHQIESIEQHSKSNKNVMTKEPKTFFTADNEKKGTKLVYQDKTSFFGLFKTRIGSPFHDIDYSNENYYDGQMCMGCHSHKQNANNFAICDLEVVENEDSKETCITCHMPQERGSMVNHKDTKTHAYHGTTALKMKPVQLSKYIELTLEKQEKGFAIYVKNLANHTLVPHPLRLSKLKVSIERDGKMIALDTEEFIKVIGTEGKKSMPWLATEVLKDTLIKGFEKREVIYEDILEKGDTLHVEFGYHIVNPNIADTLKITDKKLLKFVILKKQKFSL
ncbi:MAG TPA: hypothetical protein EYG95_05315 [Campylobacterales bacterium]|nr:hypothetical protein [Campylobacterales bacterium]